MEFITRGDRRRIWAVEQKRGIALESLDPSTTPTDVARRYGITSGLLYTWRRQLREGQLGSAPQPLPGFARVELAAEVPRLTAPEPVQPISDPPPPVPLAQTPPAQTPPHTGLIEIALRTDARTRDYVARRMAEGHSKLEAIRCLKRYIAREVFALITQRQRAINQTRIVA